MIAAPAPGSIVAIGRRLYEVVRSGCATDWAQCPHGDEAVTVRRVAPGRPDWATECYPVSRLAQPVE